MSHLGLRKSNHHWDTHSQRKNRSFAHRFRKSNNQPKFWCQLAASEMWFDPVGLFHYLEPLRVSVRLTIQRRLRPWNTKSKLPFMGMKPEQSKMYCKIWLIELGTARPAVAVIWMMLCLILKWKGSIFLIKSCFWKNIHNFIFYSRFKF